MPPAPQLVAWGSYDAGKPRVRLLLDELRARRVLAAEINIDIWRGVEDKSVAGIRRWLVALLRLLIGYPAALIRLARQPRGVAILLPYPAILDAFVVRPFARLRGQRIVFDAFIGLHDTVVSDRGKLAPNGFAARLLWRFERAALRCADVVLVDTDEHGHYFATTFGLPPERIVTALVGAEPLFWAARNAPPSVMPKLPDKQIVLFYGQLIPLHGLATILDAAAATADSPFHWLIVGRGQEEARLHDFIARHAPANLTWLPWVDYAELPALIRRATVALGVFGAGDKAGRVIPNKAFQVLAAGGMLITRDSPAMHDLARRFPDAIRLVAPGDGAALVAAITEAVGRGPAGQSLPIAARAALSPGAGVARLIELLEPPGALPCLP